MLTVGELLKRLRYCEEDEPLTFLEWHNTPLFGEMSRDLVMTGISSTAGGGRRSCGYTSPKKGSRWTI